MKGEVKERGRQLVPRIKSTDVCQRVLAGAAGPGGRRMLQLGKYSVFLPSRRAWIIASESCHVGPLQGLLRQNALRC